MHGCTIADEVLIGMGAIILNGAHIGKHSIIGAGCVVPENMVIPQKSVVVGVPAKIIKKTSESQVSDILSNAQHYIKLSKNWISHLANPFVYCKIDVVRLIMENLLNYVHLRRDIDFSVRPFNEVDMLVCADLSYVDWDGIVEKDEVSLEEACRKYLSLYSEEELKSKYTFSMNLPHLIDALQDTIRYGNIKLKNYKKSIAMKM